MYTLLDIGVFCLIIIPAIDEWIELLTYWTFHLLLIKKNTVLKSNKILIEISLPGFQI